MKTSCILRKNKKIQKNKDTQLMLANKNIKKKINNNNNNTNSLSIIDFIKQENINIDTLFIDKFWNNIKNDDPILIDDQIVRWLTGNQNALIKTSRKNLKKKIIKCNFKFKELTYNEGDKYLSPSKSILYETKQVKYLKQMKFILIQPDDFKMLCMMCNTYKGREIRQYYINLEKIFKKYIIYQQKIKFEQQKIKFEQQEIKFKKKLNYCQQELINFKKLKNKKEFIYIISSKTYAEQGLYKIGRTKNNPKSRLSTLNSGHCIKDKLQVITSFKVYNSKAAEDRIKMILNNIRDHKNREFYKGIYCHLEEIVKLICDNLYEESEKINTLVTLLTEMKNFDDFLWTKGIKDLSIFETNVNLISKNKETNEIELKEDLTKEEKENIIIKILRSTRKEFKNSLSYEDIKNNIKKFRYIKHNDISKILNNNEYKILIIKNFINSEDKLKYKE